MLFAFLCSLSWGQIPLNEATVAELSALDGISQKQAEDIVKLRKKLGRIDNIETLRAVDLSDQALDTLRREIVIMLPLASVGRPKANTYASAEEVLAEFSHEPTVTDVQRMAMVYSKTNPARIDGWLSSVQRAYALPKVNVQYEKDLDESSRYDYIAVGEEADYQIDYRQLGNDDKVVVKLEWRLDKLVMSSEQIRVLNESQKAVKVREKLMDEVTRLYFDRRRLQVEGMLSPATSLTDEIEFVLRLQELTANLDALTGGEFSASVRSKF